MDKLSSKVKFYVVDFEEGSQIVQGSWLSDDLTVCSWPPWGGQLDQVLYDKKMRATSSPQADWKDYDVIRIRAKGDNFEYVRKKLRDAVLYEETDLNTDLTDAEANKPKRKRRLRIEDETDDEPFQISDKGHANLLEKFIKKKLPQPPKINKRTETEVSAEIHPEKRKISTTTTPIKTSTSKITLTPTGVLNCIRIKAPSITSTPTTSSLSNSSSRNRSLCASPSSCDVTYVNDPVHDEDKPPTADDKIGVIAKKMTDIEFRTFVMKHLLNCNRRLAVIHKDLQNIKGTNIANKQILNINHQQLLAGVPLKTNGDMIEWDTKLLNKDFARKVTLSLAQLGGEDYASCTRAILTKVMSNSCAEMFSYLGSRGNKNAFHNLCFKDVLFSAVRTTSNGKFATVTNEQLAAVVKGWLRLASRRAGGSGSYISKRRKIIDDPPTFDNTPGNPPAHTDDTTITFDETPITFDETPITFDETPITFDETPIKFDETPITFDETPIMFDETPNTPAIYHETNYDKRERNEDSSLEADDESSNKSSSESELK